MLKSETFEKQFSNPVQQLILIKTPVKSANGIELLSLCLLEATIPSSILHNQMYLKTLMNTDGKDRIQTRAAHTISLIIYHRSLMNYFLVS